MTFQPSDAELVVQLQRPEAELMACQLVCEWCFEVALNAERTVSALPFHTKRWLLYGNALCCCSSAQEANRASLTLDSSRADCSHKVMKTDSCCCHSATDNINIGQYNIFFLSWLDA